MGPTSRALLEPRRRAERALLSVVQEAYVGGVSTRRVEELVVALGVTNLSKSEVSRICAGLDTEVDAFRSRPLETTGYPYVSLDALYHKVREGGRVVSMATLIAIGVSATGQRSVLGVEVAAAGGSDCSRRASWSGRAPLDNHRSLSGAQAPCLQPLTGPSPRSPSAILTSERTPCAV